MNIDLATVVQWFVVLVGISLALAVLLLVWVVWRVRRVNLPPGADFMTTLRATPFEVVLLLDLLDFALDFLSAPIAWVLLGRLGLGALRGITVVEDLIPGTQLIPTMTLAWLAARLLAPKWQVHEQPTKIIRERTRTIRS